MPNGETLRPGEKILGGSVVETKELSNGAIRVLVQELGRSKPATAILAVGSEAPEAGSKIHLAGRWRKTADGFEFSGRRTQSIQTTRGEPGAGTEPPLPGVTYASAANGERFTFFFTEHSPFSQWNRSASFSIPLPVDLLPKGSDTSVWRGRFGDPVRMNCCEQSMMFHKAFLFGDMETAAKILAADHPKQQKALGREVGPFDEERWKSSALDIVKRGNRARYSQNPGLAKTLAGTRGTTLVEASPYDRIWGIGLGANDPAALDRRKWRGGNDLGRVLTEMRDEEFLDASRPPPKNVEWRPGLNVVESDALARVNTVNCVGVMGKGVALAFKNAHPEMMPAYRRACGARAIRPGTATLFPLADGGTMAALATKDDWRNPSRYGWIADGLLDLRAKVEAAGISSLALPPPGCGNGGLDWNQVGAMVLDAFSGWEGRLVIAAAEPRTDAARSAAAAAEMSAARARKEEASKSSAETRLAADVSGPARGSGSRE